ncbi:MAG: hypothetical protein DIU80_018575 [Chloroflexota bacterium]
MSRLVAIAIVAAGLIPAVAYAGAGRLTEALLCAIAGAAWLGGLRRGLGWPGTVGFLLLVGLAGFAVLSSLAPAWGLASVAAALVAWDLTGFALRLQAIGRVVDEERLWRAHARRLAAVVGAGLALGAAALLVRIELGFIWVLLLGLAGVVALSRVVATLKN